MDEKMDALHSRGAWDLVTVPPGSDIVGCRWVFTVKNQLDGTVDRLRPVLLARGLTTLRSSHVARFNSICAIFSVVIN